jgi:hypothetical protein
VPERRVRARRLARTVAERDVLGGRLRAGGGRQESVRAQQDGERGDASNERHACSWVRVAGTSTTEQCSRSD